MHVFATAVNLLFHFKENLRIYLSLTILLFMGSRYMHTLQKLPKILPKINADKKNTLYIFIWDAKCNIPSIQYCTNITASWRCK